MEDPADLMVHMSQAGVVAHLGLAHQFRIQRALGTVIAVAAALDSLRIGPVAHEGRPQVLIPVHIKVAGRSVKGRMRPHKGSKQEEGLASVPAA